MKREYRKLSTYPDAKRIAEDFIINESYFKPKWEIGESRDFVILYGIYLFRNSLKPIEEIPFRVYFPKRSENPRKEATVRLYTNNRTRHLNQRHNFRNHLQGLFTEKIKKLD